MIFRTCFLWPSSEYEVFQVNRDFDVLIPVKSYPLRDLGSCRAWEVESQQKCLRSKPKLWKITQVFKGILLLASLCLSVCVCKIQLIIRANKIIWVVQLIVAASVCKTTPRGFWIFQNVFATCNYFSQMIQNWIFSANSSWAVRLLLRCSFWVSRTYRQGKSS